MSANINSEIRVVKLGGGDTIINEIYQNDLKKLVVMLDDNYPGIDLWFNRKVIPGLNEKERISYIVYVEENPVGSIIIKKGDDLKLCSMRISPDFQNKGIGNLLISLLGREIKSSIGELHFTAPKSIYDSHKRFFDKFGFQCLGEAGVQYRLFDKEILCSVNSNILWEKVLNNLSDTVQRFILPGNPKHPDIVMSIKPKFAAKIKLNKKSIEIRRKFSKKWVGSYVMLYATEPLSEFFGEAKISDIIVDNPKHIWQLYNSELGVNESEYNLYCKGTEQVSALILTDINLYKNSIPKTRVEFLLNKELNAPQSYTVIKEGTTWPTAVSLNYLLLA